MDLAVVSGYFNPFHAGHLDYLEGAAELGDGLLVVVNNDIQQRAKYDQIITPEFDRLRLIMALKITDWAMLSVDQGPGQGSTLLEIRKRYPKDRIVFCNGGDRAPNDDDIPRHERQCALQANIELRFGVGGSNKHDSSSRLHSFLEPEGL